MPSGFDATAQQDALIDDLGPIDAMLDAAEDAGTSTTADAMPADAPAPDAILDAEPADTSTITDAMPSDVPAAPG